MIRLPPAIRRLTIGVELDACPRGHLPRDKREADIAVNTRICRCGARVTMSVQGLGDERWA